MRSSLVSSLFPHYLKEPRNSAGCLHGPCNRGRWTVLSDFAFVSSVFTHMLRVGHGILAYRAPGSAAPRPIRQWYMQMSNG